MSGRTLTLNFAASLMLLKNDLSWPEMTFTWLPHGTSVLNPTLTFNDLSQNLVDLKWPFNDFSVLSDPKTRVEYLTSKVFANSSPDHPNDEHLKGFMHPRFTASEMHPMLTDWFFQLIWLIKCTLEYFQTGIVYSPVL